jgi:hypothetical protein
MNHQLPLKVHSSKADPREVYTQSKIFGLKFITRMAALDPAVLVYGTDHIRTDCTSAMRIKLRGGGGVFFPPNTNLGGVRDIGAALPDAHKF